MSISKTWNHLNYNRMPGNKRVSICFLNEKYFTTIPHVFFLFLFFASKSNTRNYVCSKDLREKFCLFVGKFVLTVDSMVHAFVLIQY